MNNPLSLRLLGAFLGVIALAGCVNGPQFGPSDASPVLTRVIELPGVGVPPGTPTANGIPGRLDHLAFDPETNRLYVAALEQGSLEVVDLNTGQRIERIEGLKKPQGIAVVRSAETASAHHGWIVVGCGGDDMARAFDATTLAEVAATPAGENADNVRFDGHCTVYVGTGDNEGPGALAVFDARTLARTGSVPLPLRPESFQLSKTDARIFANTPGGKSADNDGSVVVVDRASGATLSNWTIAGAARNFPLAYDAAHDRLFFACRKPAKVYAIDAKSGEILSQSPCVADSDDLFYDAATSRVFVIGGGRRAADSPTEAAPTPGADAALEIYDVGPDGKLTRFGWAPTAPHARTGLFVADRRAVYVVAPPHDTHDARVLEFRIR